MILSEFKTIKITSKGHGIFQSLAETVRNAGLLRAFTVRDFKVRYVQTYLGYLWGVLQPLLGLAVIFVLFSKIADIQTDGIPYLPFALSGLIFWNYFNFVVTQSSSSLIAAQAMIKKIYFPRLSVPFSKSLVGLVDWIFGIVLLAALLIFYDVLSAKLILGVVILLLTATVSMGIGLIISALSIRFRDLQQILPFLVQLLFFLTPVAYPASLLQKVIPQNWEWLAYVNPMMGILELWRHWLFGLDLNPLFAVSVAMGFFILFIGILVFTKTEKKMADLL